MNRRTFVKSLAATSIAGVTGLRRAQASVPKTKITRVRVYAPPNPNPLFNQSDLVVTVETDAGLTGIGEGGSKDMLEQCAGRLIGKDPSTSRSYGKTCRARSSTHPAVKKSTRWAHLDLALWDIKGKLQKLPCTRSRRMVRNHCECYNTAGVIPGIRQGMSIKERAHATIEAGYRAFRMDAASTTPNTHLQYARKTQPGS